MFFKEAFYMTIIYQCSHCEHLVGALSKGIVQISQLGKDHLTREERKEMIRLHKNGDVYIRTICESCEKSFIHHPQYHELDYFLQ